MKIGAWIFLTYLLQLFGSGSQEYWDWQLSEPYDLDVDVQVLIIEPDDVTADQVATLKARGVRPICYVSIGTWESYREDAALFPPNVLGATMEDWEDEKYLDIRQINTLVPIMAARFLECAEKGFVGVEPDNMDSYENENGFGLTKNDALAYIEALLALAQHYGLEMAQKNAPELVPDLVDKLDFMLVEECFVYDFCADVMPYRFAGKDVLAVEYEDSLQSWTDVCERAKKFGFHLLVKDHDVSTGGQTCRFQ